MSFRANKTYRSFATVSSLVLLTVVVYVPALYCGFIWDDDAYVVNNETLRSVGGLGQIWFQFGATPDYYPLTFTTFWLEYQAWGLEPFGYHLDNVLLHALNVVIVYWLLTRLRVPGAFFAAALFAVHPVHVESVAWITERKNVLSGLCFLLSVGAFVRAYGLDEEEPAPRIRWRFYLLSVGFFFLAMLSKTVTLTLPLILPVLIWWKTGRVRARDVLLTLPYFAVATPVILLGF
ncbi:MAG: tetratricopeptide repeat protein, partial [Planctomycetota bacterium]